MDEATYEMSMAKAHSSVPRVTMPASPDSLDNTLRRLSENFTKISELNAGAGLGRTYRGTAWITVNPLLKVNFVKALSSSCFMTICLKMPSSR